MMHLVTGLAALASLLSLVVSEPWPYNRYHAAQVGNGQHKADRSRPEFDGDPDNHFGRWFHRLVKNDDLGLKSFFVNGSVPHNATFDDILHNLAVRGAVSPGNHSALPPHIPRPWPKFEANTLFKHLSFPLDPRCTSDKTKW